jgi:predicted ATP-grasp superfamily ATP-dependent carboligase
MTPQGLVILGASVRAAAFSAARAGFLPWGADLFADLDLRRRAHAVRVDDYPQGLAAAARQAPEGPWLYTGGLENYPELVDRIADSRPLLGNRGDALRAVRDPRCLDAQLRAAGLCYPAVAFSPERLPRDGSWLRKPLRSSGGLGIEVWRGQPAHAGRGPYHYQARIEGLPCSAVYAAAGGRAVLLGATRQLSTAAEPGDPPFCYAGSVGPLRLEPVLDEQLQTIGQELARRFSLMGLFGVDLILADRRFWVIEVNPRFTASVEVLERACGFRAIAIHVGACRDGQLPPQAARPTTWCGKAILTAPSDLVVPAAIEKLAGPTDLTGWPALADIPAAGSRIRAGGPIATVLAEAADEPSLTAALGRQASQLEALLLG